MLEWRSVRRISRKPKQKTEALDRAREKTLVAHHTERGPKLRSGARKHLRLARKIFENREERMKRLRTRKGDCILRATPTFRRSLFFFPRSARYLRNRRLGRAFI
jgi:hypothetical protein